MAAEARDDVAMTAGLAGGEFVDLAEVIGRLEEQRFGETDAALLQVEPLRVSEREKEERPFPDGPELVVVTLLQPSTARPSAFSSWAYARAVSRYTVREN